MAIMRGMAESLPHLATSLASTVSLSSLRRATAALRCFSHISIFSFASLTHIIYIQIKCNGFKR